MAHWAKVEDGVVTQVNVVEDDFLQANPDRYTGTWIKTSYNTHGGVHTGSSSRRQGCEYRSRSRTTGRNGHSDGHASSGVTQTFSTYEVGGSYGRSNSDRSSGTYQVGSATAGSTVPPPRGLLTQ